MKFSNLKLCFSSCSYMSKSFLIIFFFSLVYNTISINEINKFKNSAYLIDFKYYHTTDSIDKELNQMKLECPHIIKEVSYDEFYNIPLNKRSTSTKYVKYYDFTDSTVPDKNKDKIFILTGEHPRELIAVESVFEFMKYICRNKSPAVAELLKKNIIRINVNSNPNKRIEVERGDFCIRGNMNNVDINRNWDFFWGKSIGMSEEHPGKSPFSEFETLFIKDSVAKLNPKLFLSIHSGEYSLFHPYAYIGEKSKNNIQFKNKDQMINILNNLKNEVCPHCKVGYPQEILGYQASGSCIDYVFEKFKVPYSFAWEIYTNEKPFKEMIEYKKNLRLQLGKSDKPRSFLETNSRLSLRANSYRRLLKERDFSNQENVECFKLFNPDDKETYDFITKTWRKGIMKIIDLVNKN